MIIRLISQPQIQLGSEISDLLDSEVRYSRINLVSAFAALRTILRLRERLLAHVQAGTNLVITVGIDLGGTSREVLEELLRWNCRTFIFHNPNARATFHPKVYLFETSRRSTLFVGSNNLTDGGLYTNYEAAARYDFNLPADTAEYDDLLSQLDRFLNPIGPTVRPLDAGLLQTLIARGELPSETQARRNTGRSTEVRTADAASLPANPFSAVAVPFPPLLPRDIRGEDHALESLEQRPTTAVMPPAEGSLVWRKTLTRSDALQVRRGTAHVGGVRLTQAQFEYLSGQRIDQTTYFRRLFADFNWQREAGRRRSEDQEHAFVPMRIMIRGRDYGVHRFEISHKPSGEAGQNNYTTILRWGHEFNHIVPQENISGATFSLYETNIDSEPYLIDIRD